MNTKQQTMAILVLVMSLVISGCGPGQFLGSTLTPTSIPPTLTPIPIPTSIPKPTPTVQAAIVTTCDQYGNIDINGKIYVIQNGMWNPSSGGTQCLSVDNVTGAYTVTKQTNSQRTNGAPASYPFIYKGCHWGYCTDSNPMPIQVSAISSATSSWSITTAAGIWNASYDIWFNTTPTTSGAPDGTELMIWLNSQGGVQPSGSVVASGVNIDGATYNVWFSQDSGSKYVAYRKTKVSTSLSPDIKAFINDAGFEIWNGGVGMGTNSFSVSVSGDGG